MRDQQCCSAFMLPTCWCLLLRTRRSATCMLCLSSAAPPRQAFAFLHVLYVFCPVLLVSAFVFTPISACLQAAILAGSRQTQNSDVTMVDAGPWPTEGGNRQQVSTCLWLDTPQLSLFWGCCQL